ncbi:MAG: 1-phosphofructokinase family hexose kinase [Simplicispira sp.]|nr:1-phosphofructokinase family hexose kinase [Simplicispira sp.]
MSTFLTLTPNPALDLATRTERVQPTHKLRCGPLQRYPGGGGVNVARVLQRLGGDVQAWFLAGGATGAQLQPLLAAEGVRTQTTPIQGETRENFSVVQTSTGDEFRFVLPGPQVQAHEWQGWQDSITALAPLPRWTVASGSLPPGVPNDFYAHLARQVHAQGQRLVLDSSGAALAAALQVGVYLVKPSLRELRELTGAALTDTAQWCTAAQALVQRGQADMVALSAGEHGAVLATRGGVWQAPALPVAATTGTTGAGDCFLAALVWALEQGESPPEALRWGVAAGSAALLAPGTALADSADIRRLHGQVALLQVA